MIPILFPYTYVPQALARTLTRWFDVVGVYQPSEHLVPEEMQRWCQDSAVQFRFPVRSEDRPLAKILEDFHRWSTLQRDRRGIGSAYRKSLEGGPPFFEADLPSHIRADIKRRISGVESAEDAERDLLQARVFLAIAQELDRQSDLLENDLARLDDLEIMLMESMHEPEEAAAALSAARSGKITGRREESDYMLAERLAAWTRLMASDASLRKPEALAVFVTPGRVVLDSLLEAYPDAACALLRSEVPAGVEDRIEIQKQLADLSRSGSPIPAATAAAAEAREQALSAFVLPDVRPLTAFARIADRPELDFDTPGMFPTARSTVIVFVPVKT